MQDSTVQNYWSDGQVLGIDCIAFGSDDLILMTCATLIAPDSDLPLVAVSPLARSTVKSVLEFHPDVWADTTTFSTFEWRDKGRRLFSGEGGMGNEGFVAAIESATNSVAWIAFFTRSNPFVRVFATNNDVVAHDNLGRVWLFPYENPEKVCVFNSMQKEISETELGSN